MNKIIATILTAATLTNCNNNAHDDAAHFTYFTYQGGDVTNQIEINPYNQYTNPIIPGFYPDPSVCRNNNDFFLVTSSFAYFPGIPIFHSPDLVNWIQIGHVLNRPSQLKIDSVRLSGGVYAPTIRFNKHNKTFYVINTCVDGIGNFIVKTNDPLKQYWTDPIKLPKVHGIDPDLFFDDDGKAYIVHNDEPTSTPEWEGHRTIRLHQFDTDADTTLNNPIVIVDGGTDKSLHPVWIEAPHLYKINGKYLLLCAQGGTAEQHSEVAFIATNVHGPYIPYKNNPVLTQRDLPNNRPNPVTSAGHADIVQTQNGDYWAVFLACRPYIDNHYNTGRETFLLPVTWDGDVPIILPKQTPIPYKVDKPNLQPNTLSLKGNFNWLDDFNTNKLHDRWISLRNTRSQWWKLTNNGLHIIPNGISIYQQDNPAFVAARQQHINFIATTEMNFNPIDTGDIAGIVAFQNEKHNYVLGKTKNKNGQLTVTLIKAENGNVNVVKEVIIPTQNMYSNVTLKVTANGAQYQFNATLKGNNDWNFTAIEDGTVLSTKTAKGFTGAIVGMYAYKKQKL